MKLTPEEQYIVEERLAIQGCIRGEEPTTEQRAEALAELVYYWRENWQDDHCYTRLLEWCN